LECRKITRVDPNHGTVLGQVLTGRESDREAPLYYYRRRYYSSQFGRFLSRDPLLEVSEDNLYVYADNRPPVLGDPGGEFPVLPLPMPCGKLSIKAAGSAGKPITQKGAGCFLVTEKQILQAVNQELGKYLPWAFALAVDCASGQKCCDMAKVTVNGTVKSTIKYKIPYVRCTVTAVVTLSINASGSIGICFPDKCQCPPAIGNWSESFDITIPGELDVNKLQEFFPTPKKK
jgi:RHS repeat-associated protein